MMKYRALCTLLSSCLFAAGCTGGSETGNPVASTKLALSAHTSDRALADVRLTTPGVYVEEAWVSFAEIEFELADACGLDLAVENEFVVPSIALDLAEGPLAPSMLELPDAEFCRLEIEIEARELPLPGGAPSELEGASVVIVGSDPADRPFMLVSAVEVSLEVRPMTGSVFTLVDPSDPRFVVSFDLAVWLGGMNFDAAVVGADGIIHITDVENRDLLDAFEASFEAAIEGAFDRNGNGRYDDGEELEAN